MGSVLCESAGEEVPSMGEDGGLRPGKHRSFRDSRDDSVVRCYVAFLAHGSSSLVCITSYIAHYLLSRNGLGLLVIVFFSYRNCDRGGFAHADSFFVIMKLNQHFGFNSVDYFFSPVFAISGPTAVRTLDKHTLRGDI